MSVDNFQVQDGYECPTCEKVLNTSLGLKQHHTKVHGESLVETAECQWCSDEFHVKPTQVGNFCSVDCQMERRKSEGLPARSRRVELECEGCGETFSTARSNAENGKKYCSMECYKNDSQADYVTCETCGEDFYVKGSYVDEARFCSQDCYGEWLSETNSGKDSWHWKGGQQNYGEGWTPEKRRRVRRRDGYECAICGTSQDDHDGRLHVHHIVPARDFEDAERRNAMDNLITLCQPCHMRAEKLAPLLPGNVAD